MKNSDFIIDWVENHRSIVKQFAFVENDVRLDFFGLINDIAYCYYRNYLLFEISTLMSQKKISVDFVKNNKHIKAVEFLTRGKETSLSHFNSMNRQLLVDSWSTFEMCLNIFATSVLNQEEINKLLNTNYSNAVKAIGKNILSEEQLEKLKVSLTQENLTHISITRKIDSIFKIVKGYSRNIQDDKKFLLFYLKFRNSMHSNYIYYGKSFEYEFGHAKFIFINEKQIVWSDPFKETPKLYFHLMGNLRDIWKAIILTIPFEERINYPDLDQF